MKRRGKGLLIGILAALLLLGLASCGSRAVSGAAGPVSVPAAGAGSEGNEQIVEEDPAPSQQPDTASEPAAEEDVTPPAEQPTDPEEAPDSKAAAPREDVRTAETAHPSGSEAPAPPAASDAPAAPDETAAALRETDDAAPETAGASPYGPSSDAPSETAADAPPEVPASRVTITIQCLSVLDNADSLAPGKASVVPESGVMLPPTSVEIAEGDTVYDVLLRAAGGAGLVLDEKSSLGSVYIRGIGGLFEFDCGKGSGWMYKVNGVAPNYGCSRVGVKDGDEIEWYYVCG